MRIWGVVAAFALMACGADATLFGPAGQDHSPPGVGGAPTTPLCNGLLCDDGNACTNAVCVDGNCVYTPVEPGGECEWSGQSGVCDEAGACQPLGCDDPALSCDDANPCTADSCEGAGVCSYEALSGEGADDDNNCTEDRCVLGQPVHVALAVGTVCAHDLPIRYVCDGEGGSVECVGPEHCNHLGITTECAQRTCEDKLCGQVFTPDGTSLSPALQAVGDCHRAVCDGEGEVRLEIDDADLPNDANACTVDSCLHGAPKHAPLCAPNQQCFNGTCY
jgi:hypothetical protein